MFKTYNEYVKFQQTMPEPTYDVGALAIAINSLLSEKQLRYKDVADMTKVSVTSVYYAAKSEYLTKGEYIDGQWIKVVDEKTLSKLIAILPD
ncbi:hypothetical protein H6G27_34995 [Nostoc linckia FACHB-104]|nr:hypothetical protein [Nostoc linckia FACHB-104]